MNERRLINIKDGKKMFQQFLGEALLFYLLLRAFSAFEIELMHISTQFFSVLCIAV